MTIVAIEPRAIRSDEPHPNPDSIRFDADEHRLIVGPRSQSPFELLLSRQVGDLPPESRAVQNSPNAPSNRSVESRRLNGQAPRALESTTAANVAASNRFVRTSMPPTGDRPLTQVELPTSGTTTAATSAGDGLAPATAFSLTIAELLLKFGLAEAFGNTANPLASIPPNRELTIDVTEVESTSAPIQTALNLERGLKVEDSHRCNVPAAVEASKTFVPAARPHTPRIEDSTSTLSATILNVTQARLAYASAEAPVADELATAIGRHLGGEPHGGPTSVQIRLDRPELGTVNLHLSIVNDVVSIRIVARDEVARQIIDSQLNDLRQSLSDSGVSCGQCQVACDSSGRQFSNRSELARPVVARPSTSTRWARLTAGGPSTVPPRGQLNFVA